MIQLVDVTEQNWIEIVSLSVAEDQKHFLATRSAFLRGAMFTAPAMPGSTAYPTGNTQSASRL